MKTIQVNKYTREKIREFARDESVNDTLNRLMDLSESLLQADERDYTKTNISIDESTLDRLKTYKLKPTESHSDTILRMLENIKK